MTHLGTYAVNNTMVGVRNEQSNKQFVADSGSSFNNVVTGGTFFTGGLVDNGSRNSFQDAFHYNVNGWRGNWYASQQDVTITDHERLGIGVGNERGRATEYQTDFGYRWMTGLSDGTSGSQEWFVTDLLSNVRRFSANQYLTASTGGVLVTNVIINNGGCFSAPTAQPVTFTGGGATTQATGVTVMITSATCSGGYQVGSITMLTNGSGYTTQPDAAVDTTYQITAPHLVAEISASGSSNNQTVINSTGIGAVVINGSNNSGTGGVVIGSGGPNASTNAAPIILTSGGNINFMGYLNFMDSSGNSQWQSYTDNSLNFVLRNSNNPANPNAIKIFQNNAIYFNSAGAYGVQINPSVNSGTGGFQVYSGGSSPQQWFSVGNSGYTKVTSLAGSGHRCVYADSVGGLNVEGSDCGTSNSNGTITSVSLSMSPDFTVTGSPVTASGTLSASWSVESPHTFLAGAATGSTSVAPTWRAIVVADVPTLNQNTTGTAANITATSNSTLTTLSALALPYSQLSGTVPTWNQSTTGTAANITATTNTTLVTLSALALPYSQLSGTVPTWNQNTTGTAANITATSNSTLTTLSALALPIAQVTGGAPINAPSFTGNVTGAGFFAAKFYIGNGAMTYTTKTAAGAGSTLACTASHACDQVQGTVTLTTGTPTTTGQYFALGFNNTHTNLTNCHGNLALAGTGQLSNWELSYDTTHLYLSIDTTALTASTAYTFTYWCGGN
jgi:hypothetical protein